MRRRDSPRCKPNSMRFSPSIRKSNSLIACLSTSAARFAASAIRAAKSTRSPPFEGNAAAFVDETLPLNIDVALLALENSAILREYLGRAYVDLYCATKRTELRRYREAITAREYQWYL